MTSHEDPPHLLYVAWGFPPNRGGGVYRALATANTFAEQGWKVTVLTVNPEAFEVTAGVDESLLDHIRPDVDVVRIDYDVASTQTDLTAWSWPRARFTELWMAQRVLRNMLAFPEPGSGSWRRTVEKAALRIHEETPVDLTIGTANPYIDFAPGYALHKAAGVPYILDYRDAWQLNILSGRRVTGPRSLVARTERKLMRSAHQVWFVNQPILDWHADLYPDVAGRMRVVMNGFDAELADFPADRRDPDSTRLVFGYIGTLYSEVPFRTILEGWRLAKTHAPELADAAFRVHGYLGHQGDYRPDALALFDEFAHTGASYEGPVGKATIADTYAGFDALVLMIGPGRHVTSGKVFEYMATGLPIVSVHDAQSGAVSVLEGHASWVLASEMTERAIADAFIAGARMAAAQTAAERAAIQSWAARYERRNQLLPRIAELEGQLNKRGEKR